MPKKVIYFVDIYEPSCEGISKEVHLLHSYFRESFVYCMSPFFGIRSLFRMKVDEKSFIFCSALFPLRTAKNFFERKFDLSHVFGNLYGDYFVRNLKKKPILLTAVTIDRIHSIDEYEKLEKIVVESNKQKKMLVNAGLEKDKIELVYPGVDLNKFSYSSPTENTFKVLFASSPLKEMYFRARGIDMILEAAQMLQEYEFVLLWRKRALVTIKRMIEAKKLKNVKLINEIIADMNNMYGNVHATVVPFTSEEFNKSCPNSIPESLAAGKPVIVSDKVGISDIIKKERCGVVFKPTPSNLSEAIKKISKGYKKYQKNARKTAKKYFSKEKFLLEYEKIYDAVVSK